MYVHCYLVAFLRNVENLLGEKQAMLLSLFNVMKYAFILSMLLQSLRVLQGSETKLISLRVI